MKHYSALEVAAYCGVGSRAIRKAAMDIGKGELVGNSTWIFTLKEAYAIEKHLDRGSKRGPKFKNRRDV